MSAYQRSARRLVGAVAVILGGLTVSALADTGDRTTAAPATAAPTAATAPVPAATMPTAFTASADPAVRAAQAQRTFSTATSSSPIAMSRDGRLVWVVNPGADTVTVIRTSNNTVLRTIRVGDEPQGVAVDPSNRYVFVANAAGNSVSVIRISNPSPTGAFRARSIGRFTTGAEPWNVVVSPDGRRAFVANSGQDTITVIDARNPKVIGNVDLTRGRCAGPDRDRHFQPRGLAVDRNSNRLYVTSFLAFTRPGGKQGDDGGRQGVVCRVSVDTDSDDIDDYRPAKRVTLAPQVTGFTVDRDGNGTPDPTSAFPNQLQSIVIRGGQAYLPNIAASPDGPLRFDVSTQAFVNTINGVRTGEERDGAPGRFLNLHLGARDPEPGKKKLFFANAWAIGFTNQSGAGFGYVVAAGSDLLVKVRVAADGRLAFTTDADTTRYIDLDDPANPATAGANAGKNPQGIVVNSAGTRAYVTNFVSRNVSVVDLRNDRVIKVIQASPPANTPLGKVVSAGAEMFFSSRGNFNRPAGATGSTSERLSQAGWQSCSSCHFKGLTDGVVWEFATGPRKSVPLNATFNPRNPQQQRILNYSAIFDEVDDFEINIRNVSGPGPLPAPVPCNTPPPATSTLDPNHGLIIGDNGDANTPPCVVNAFAKPNADRSQLTVTPPGTTDAIVALGALREWARVAVRTPNGPLRGTSTRPGPLASDIAAGRRLFQAQGCQSCHGGQTFTLSVKDFASPPAAAEIATETTPPPTSGNPVAAQFLNRFLRDIGSFNLGVTGAGNDIGGDVGAVEKATANLVAGVAQPQQDALGRDYNGDGKGVGYNVPSLLGINAVPPYYHNGACETLACVVGNPKHRTANGRLPDRLQSARAQAQLVAWLKTVTAATAPVP
jgi:YVTN family beta-propeller protein